MNLAAVDVSYERGPARILERVSVEFQAGRTTALLGPNGAGKSTLIRLLAGFMAPTEGLVTLDDRPVDSYSLADRSRILGVLTQKNTLEFPFTVSEVIEMGASTGGANSHAVSAAAASAVGIDPNRVYTTLSGGERQLAQIARVLAQVWNRGSDAFLLMDEPMTALDLKHQQRVAGLLSNLKASGMGQVIVMHDINLAADIADDVVLMSEGAVVAAGETRAVLTLPNLERTFRTPMSDVARSDVPYFRARLQD